MSGTIERVLVVGGGTAGWMTAAFLARRLGAGRPGGIRVSLVESAEIGVIGVGEGSFASVKLAFTALGVDEAWFLKEASATFKQGNKFVGWAEAPDSARHPFYYHPFSAPTRARSGLDLLPYWLLGAAGAAPFDVAMGSQRAVCEARRAPKKITERPYWGAEEYAYHFDATKLAKVLAKVGQDLGVEQLIGTVRGVEMSEAGGVAAVTTAEHGRIEADFFVDCTGFAARLIGSALASPFRSVGDVLFQDRAMALQVPYPDPAGPLASSTISTAQEAGWTWDISLENRRGVGYVYSSRHTDDASAEAVLRSYLGAAADGLSPRKLAFEVGWRDRQWIANCAAIGLSGGFLEPLESTGIMMIGAAADMLSEIFPRSHEDLEPTARLFNTAMTQRYERAVDFLKLHYCLSRRTDSGFWTDHAHPASWTDYLREKIPLWRRRPPSRHDLPTAQESFPLQSYHYVLYGMGFRTELSGRAGAFPHLPLARQEFDRIAAITSATLAALPDHRALITKLYANGYRTPAKAA
ncbi:MAG: tryptophan halogenase family protein [Caulobacteraceae bacterium]